MKVLLLLAAAAVGMIEAAGIVYPIQSNDHIGEYTQWFDSDNPFGGRYDDERIAHIKKVRGSKCTQMPWCKEPLVMEVDFSDKHRAKFPEASLDDAIACLGDAIPIEAQNQTLGFFCDNAALRQPGRVFSEDCLKNVCPKSGMVYKHSQNNKEENCEICPNFKVRYFCMDNDEKVCQENDKWSRNIDSDNLRLIARLIEELGEE